MPEAPDLTKLSHAEKDALILALLAQLTAADERMGAQDARIAALEARLGELSRPPKTPDNSSKPPSQGQKSDCPAPGDRPPRGPFLIQYTNLRRTVLKISRLCFGNMNLGWKTNEVDSWSTASR